MLLADMTARHYEKTLKKVPSPEARCPHRLPWWKPSCTQPVWIPKKRISIETALEMVNTIAARASACNGYQKKKWLSDRELLIGDQRTSKVVTCVVHQGSVFGLMTLGNVEYDYLLSMDIPVEVNRVGFADNLAEVAKS